MTNNKSIQYCPFCDNEVSSDNINISEGVALCGNCDNLCQLSQLNFTGSTTEEIIDNPPKGCQIKSDNDSIEIKVSLFSFTKFMGSLFVTLFWNGVLSVFLSLAAAAVYYNLYGPVPDWFPAPGLENGKPIMNDVVMGVGMTISLCLFLAPFVVVGICLFVNTLLRLFGATKIVLRKNYSYVSTGISIIILKSTFDPKNAKSIKSPLSKLNQENQHNHVIEIVSSKSTKFGLLLSGKQQEWVIALLKLLLIPKKPSKLSNKVPKLYWLDQ